MVIAYFSSSSVLWSRTSLGFPVRSSSCSFGGRFSGNVISFSSLQLRSTHWRKKQTSNESGWIPVHQPSNSHIYWIMQGSISFCLGKNPADLQIVLLHKLNAAKLSFSLLYGWSNNINSRWIGWYNSWSASKIERAGHFQVKAINCGRQLFQWS